MTTILEAVAGLVGGMLAEGSVLFEIGGYLGIVLGDYGRNGRFCFCSPAVELPREAQQMAPLSGMSTAPLNVS